MPLDQKQLADAVLQALIESNEPLMAQDLVHPVAKRLRGPGVTISAIHHALQHDLQSQVVQGSDHRWSVASQSNPEPSNTDADDNQAHRSTEPVDTGGRSQQDSTSNSHSASHLKSPERQAKRRSPNTSRLPRAITLPTPPQGRRTLAIQGAGSPRLLVEANAFEPVGSELFRAYTQWQLDLPVVHQPVSQTHEATTALAVIEQAFKRGRLLPLSPKLEKYLAQCSGVHQVPDSAVLTQAFGQVALNDHCTMGVTQSFDSDEEKAFYESALPRHVSPDATRWMSGQVSLGTLTGDRDDVLSEQRVDFLFAHPSHQPLVVEIDGGQHEQSIAIDRQRDQALTAAGNRVIRIPAQAAAAGVGSAFVELTQILSRIQNDTAWLQDPVAVWISSCRRAHQLQVTILHALMQGWQGSESNDTLSVHISGLNHLNTEAIQAAVDDFNEVLEDIYSLCHVPSAPPHLALTDPADADLNITFGQSLKAQDRLERTLVISDLYLPVTFSNTLIARSLSAGFRMNPQREQLQRLLTRFFGFDDFRGGQYEGIARALQGEDTLVLLPTGAGKSIMYQMVTLLRPGICIVVDPILSLIDDQIANLAMHGIDRCVKLTSEVKSSEMRAYLSLLGRGDYQFCYVAPERFQNQEFRDTLRQLTLQMPVALIAIDETHCVSEWGHDFRPAYLNLARISREYCKGPDGPPPLMGLTGTASRAVLKDVQRELVIHDFAALITPQTFDRPELSYRIVRCDSNQKTMCLIGLLDDIARRFGELPASFYQPRGISTRAGLVFCPHVNGSYGVVRIADDLRQQFQQPVRFYSGSKPTNHNQATWPLYKKQVAADFKQNRFSLMTCTKAFGMGIDKPNIRHTYHYGIPASMESFYQEAGRAGRDGQSAYCTLIFSDDHPQRTDRLLNPAATIESVHKEMKRVTLTNGDDVTRVLFFHTKSFQGAPQDLVDMDSVLDRIGDLIEPRNIDISFDRNDKAKTERSVYRLLILGVVSDYTVNNRGGQLNLKLSGIDSEGMLDSLYRYVAAYQRRQAEVMVARLRTSLDGSHEERVRIIAKTLIQFIYEVVERSRRQALAEMVTACRSCDTDQAFRERILTYLGTSSFSEGINGLLDTDDGGLTEAVALIEKIRSTVDASQVRGEAGRALESYPDHPGLRLARAYAEGLVAHPILEDLRSNLQAAIQFARDKYEINQYTIDKSLIEGLQQIADTQRPGLSHTILSAHLYASEDGRDTARLALELLPPSLAEPALAYLLQHHTHQLRQSTRS